MKNGRNARRHLLHITALQSQYYTVSVHNVSMDVIVSVDVLFVIESYTKYRHGQVTHTHS